MKLPLFTRLLLMIGGRLVPSQHRQDWSREWESELYELSSRPGNVTKTIRRSILCIPDAIAYRRHLPTQPEIQRTSLMDSLIEDIRFATRIFRREKLSTAILLLTLAIGIGANTVVYTLLNSIVISPLPFAQSEQLVSVWPAALRSISKRFYEQTREATTSYEALAVWTESDAKLIKDGRAQIVFGPIASAGFFDVLGARPALGRLFQEGDDRPGERVVVVTHEFWQTALGGASDVIGQTLNLDANDHTIIGVIEPGFDLLQPGARVVTPAIINPATSNYSANYLDMIGRLRPGVSVSEANVELIAHVSRLREEMGRPDTWGQTASVVSLHEFLVGNVRPTLFLLTGAVALTLLIVLANVANLLLARAMSRQTELAVRYAMGARPTRVVRQLITESVLLSLIGGALGVALAFASMRMIVASMPADTPRLSSIGIDPVVIGFALLLTIGIGLALGVAPAFFSRRSDMRAGLTQSSARSGTSKTSLIVRSSLVSVEVALAVTLTSSAGLLIRSFWETARVDPGFEAVGLSYAGVIPDDNRVATAPDLDEYYRLLKQQFNELPGVEATFIHAVPVSNSGWSMSVWATENPPGEGERPSFPNFRPVDHEYFALAGIDVIAGRTFTRDDELTDEGLVVVNQSAATSLFGSEANALGNTVQVPFISDGPLRVIGIVEDVKIRGTRAAAPSVVYHPFTRATAGLLGFGVNRRWLMLRSRQPFEQLRPTLEATLTRHDPLSNFGGNGSMEQVISDSLKQERLLMYVLIAFAAVAATLGAVGIFGVMGYAVKQRSRELSIRAALGAASNKLVGSVVLAGLKLTLAGAIAGVGVAYALSQYLTEHLFQTERFDPAVYAVTLVLLITAGLLAAWIPAQRAGNADPMDVLRTD